MWMMFFNAQQTPGEFHLTCILGLALMFFTGCHSAPEAAPVSIAQEEMPAEIPPPVEVVQAEEEEEEELELPEETGDLPVSSFREIWGYVIDGREQSLKAGYPITDVGYFGAEIDAYGKLTGVPNPAKLGAYRGRRHLVVASNGRALTHFALEPERPVRIRLVADLLAAAQAFDGLQIDFESVPARDGEVFRGFLAELKKGLNEKLLTIALPARSKTIADDQYDYRKILPLVDRILVMAYDEHWSTSAPGPIASMAWCRRVAAYALETVGPEKLIMGLPFYGRAWGSVNPSKAYIYPSIRQLIEENKVAEIRREGGIPTFTYQIPVTVSVYYEDAYSLAARLAMYQSMGVKAAGFWRVGQETTAVWKLLNLSGE